MSVLFLFLVIAVLLVCLLCSLRPFLAPVLSAFVYTCVFCWCCFLFLFFVVVVVCLFVCFGGKGHPFLTCLNLAIYR